MRSDSSKTLALACLAVCGLIWGAPNVIIRFLRHDFDPVTQSFVRYLAASVALGLPLLALRRGQLEALCSHWRALLLPSAVLAAHQLLYMVGMYYTSAMTGVFISKLSAVIIPLLSYFVFEDERRIVSHPRFLRGMTLAFVGVIGLVLVGDHAVRDTAWFGPPIMVASMLSWSAYAIIIKPVVKKVPPLALSAVMPMLSCVLFAPFLLTFGDATAVVRVPFSHLALLIFSGVLIIAIGNTCYYVALNRLGTSVTASVLLVTPLTTGILSYFVLGEHLTAWQMSFGVVLVAGCGLISSIVAGRESPARQLS